MATITYTVTVASGTNQYGTGNKFYINGAVSPDLNLVEGNTYIFDQSDSTNATGGGHILAFSTSANNSPAAPYTTGVTTTGTPGSSGANTTIVVATYAPTLYYYCTNHSGMGATAFTPAAGSISNQATFESTFTIDEVIEDAYERCGVQGITGYQLKTARRSLNILFQEWGNRGIHYWEVGNTNVLLVQGQAEYTFYRSTADGASSTTAGGTSTTSTYGLADILEASYRQNYNNTSQSDSPLTKVDRSTYTAFSNKTALGTPSQFWVQRFIDKTTMTLYQTPDSSAAGNYIYINFVKRITDAGAYDNVGDIPNRFVPCMVSGLAYYLAQKWALERVQQLKLLYEDELSRALAEDGSPTSAFISPKTYYPTAS
jgi:hypothetical protein